MYAITATILTHHKLNAIRFFGVPVERQMDGSYEAFGDFLTVEEAIRHLTARVDEYYSGEELDEKLDELNNTQTLEHDGVTAYIFELVPNKEELEDLAERASVFPDIDPEALGLVAYGEAEQVELLDAIEELERTLN